MSRNFRVFAFAAVVAWAVGAMNEANVMYALAGVAASIILIAFGLSRLALSRLRADLSVAAATVRAGGRIAANVHVRSIGGITLPSAGVEVTAENLTVPGVAESRRMLLPALPPAAELDARVELSCPARGRYRIGPAALYDSDPIGMFEYRRAQGEAVEVVALPQTVDLPRLDAWEAELGGGGQRALQVRRDRGEFHGIRQHTPGDDLRHVHWKVTAHTGELAVKEYEAVRHDVLCIYLDLRASNHSGEGARSTLETCISAAASIAAAALAEQRLVAVHGEGLPIALATPGAGEPHLHRIMVALAEIRANSRRSFTESLRTGLAQARRGASVFVVTTAAEEAMALPLGRAVSRGLSVRALLVEPPDAPDEPAEPTRRLMARLQAAGVGVGRLRSVADLVSALVAAGPPSGRAAVGVV